MQEQVVCTYHELRADSTTLKDTREKWMLSIGLNELQSPEPAGICCDRAKSRVMWLGVEVER
jgi:hypothetical protein